MRRRPRQRVFPRRQNPAVNGLGACFLGLEERRRASENPKPRHTSPPIEPGFERTDRPSERTQAAATAVLGWFPLANGCRIRTLLEPSATRPSTLTHFGEKSKPGPALEPGLAGRNCGRRGYLAGACAMTFIASAVNAVILAQFFSATSLRSAIHEPPMAATCGMAR